MSKINAERFFKQVFSDLYKLAAPEGPGFRRLNLNPSDKPEPQTPPKPQGFRRFPIKQEQIVPEPVVTPTKPTIEPEQRGFRRFLQPSPIKSEMPTAVVPVVPVLPVAKEPEQRGFRRFFSPEKQEQPKPISEVPKLRRFTLDPKVPEVQEVPALPEKTVVPAPQQEFGFRRLPTTTISNVKEEPKLRFRDLLPSKEEPKVPEQSSMRRLKDVLSPATPAKQDVVIPEGISETDPLKREKRTPLNASEQLALIFCVFENFRKNIIRDLEWIPNYESVIYSLRRKGLVESKDVVATEAGRIRCMLIENRHEIYRAAMTSKKPFTEDSIRKLF